MDKIFQTIEKSRDLIIDLQDGLTSHPAVNPDNGGDGEWEKFLYLKEYLSKWKFDATEEIIVPDPRVSSGKRPTLIKTILGKKSDRTIWFITHTDVVPPGEITLWQTDPFQIKVDGDKIIGRGTEDNQQSLVSSLVAAKAILDHQVRPEYTVKLMFVADEEVGSDYGISWIIDNRFDLFQPDDLIITPDVGDPEGISIEIAEKSILWILFKITGKQSHGSRPDLGSNAARASSHLCVRIDALREKYNKTNPLFDLPYSTIEPTKRIGTVTNMNTIPGEEILGFDCRILPEYRLDDLIREMEEIARQIEKEFHVTITYEMPQKLQAAPPTPADSPVVKLLSRSIQDVTGKTPKLIGIGGGTVAAYFRFKGLHAALWSTVDNRMHSPNEYSLISNTITDAKVFCKVMLSDLNTIR